MYLNSLSLFLFIYIEIYLLVINSNMLPFFIVFCFLAVILVFSSKCLSIFIDLEISEAENTMNQSVLNCLVNWHSFLFLKLFMSLALGVLFLKNNINLILKFSNSYNWTFNYSEKYISHISFHQIKFFYIGNIIFSQFYLLKLCLDQLFLLESDNISTFFMTDSVGDLLV